MLRGAMRDLRNPTRNSNQTTLATSYPLPCITTRTPPLAGYEGCSLFSKGNPSPEPTQQLHQAKGKEDSIAQALAAARRAVSSRVIIRRRSKQRRRRRSGRGGSVGEESEAAECYNADGGLGAPVMDQPDLLGHRECE
jgi:hypothetical protein